MWTCGALAKKHTLTLLLVVPCCKSQQVPCPHRLAALPLFLDYPPARLLPSAKAENLKVISLDFGSFALFLQP